MTTVKVPNPSIQGLKIRPLDRVLVEVAEKLRSHAEASARSAERGLAPDWERPNVFGCLGPRGAGKTTIIQRLTTEGRGAMDSASFTATRPRGNDDMTARRLDLRSYGLHVSPVVDCSIMPDEVSPAAAVLVGIAEDSLLWPELTGESPGHLSGRARPRVQHSVEVYRKLRDDLTKLAGRQVQTDAGYRKVCAELSTTPDDFPAFVTEGIRERFALRRELTDWLERAAAIFDITGFVVFLDDFDLTPGRAVRRWIGSLLEELRQSRLVFLLTADFYRLEHLSLDEVTQLDDMTGRALIDKLLPSPNRIVLPGWSRAERLTFQPLDVAEPSPLDARLDVALGNTAIPLDRDLIRALLPRLPRGLQSLYRSFDELDLPPDARMPRDPAWLLMLIATCRGEPLMARRLQEIPFDGWIKELKWSPAETTIEAWREALAAAMGHGQSPDASGGAHRLLPVVGLAPEPFRAGAPRRDQRDPLTHDPGWTDPLRHDLMLQDQLRDVREEDRDLWAELLIDLGLGRSGDHRARFLESWPPARERVQRSTFRVQMSERQLWAFFASNAQNTRQVLPWLSWDETPAERGAREGDPMSFPPEQARQDSNGFTLSIGWSPLLKSLRGARDPWPAALLERLFVGPDSVQGKIPSPREPMSLIPRRIRSATLLLDSLDRCPWRALSPARFGWSVMTYVRLAGAFVQTAYLDALLRAAGKDQSDIRRPPGDTDGRWQEAQLALLAQIDSRDPRLPSDERLLEERMLKPLAACSFLESLPPECVSSPKDPLFEAAQRYIVLESYTALGISPVRAQDSEATAP